MKAPAPAPEKAVADARIAQAAWSVLPLAARAARIGALRGLIAEHGAALAAAIGARPGRTEADSLAAEIVPLADACRFAARRAPRLLAPRRLGACGRPWWLAGHRAEVRHVPLGVVLVIGPSNYPLLLPGVQAVQALAAGNAAAIKPGAGGRTVALLFAELVARAGVDARLCPVLDESPEAARAAIAAGVDKVVLTGSTAAGRAVLECLAPRLVPATLELSGADAVFVLPGADLDMTARGLAWGLRLNGGETCIAPRRVFVPRALAPRLGARIAELARDMAPVVLPAPAAAKARRLIEDAIENGAHSLLPWPGDAAGFAPAVLADAHPGLALMQEDVFAPVLALVPVDTPDAALDAAARCPYALGAAVFGPEAEALAFARRVRSGTVTVNDLIAPTADPRLPFGGFGASGFGRTRGAEGLLEMTATQAITVRKGRFRPHYDPPGAPEAALLGAYLAAAHGAGWRARVAGAARFLGAVSRRRAREARP